MTARFARFVRPAPLMATALLLSGFASTAGAFCGPPLNVNHWGMPIDYRDPKKTYERNIVERYHFTPEIEALQKGLNGPLPGDIHYTLVQLVNHHRALQAMATWQLKNPRKASDEFYPADCYFERALAFTPDDPLIYMIWGNYAFRNKEYDRAVQIYQRAEELAPNDPEVQYNLGLLNVELKNYEKARTYAQKAYAQRYPLPGLRNKLKKAGVTLDETAPATAQPAPAQPATDPAATTKPPVPEQPATQPTPDQPATQPPGNPAPPPGAP